MTMDSTSQHRKHGAEAEVHLLNNNEDVTEVTTTKVPVKRSFDVAFLMLPDEKLKAKQLRAQRQLEEEEDGDGRSPSDKVHAKYLAHFGKQQIFGDPRKTNFDEESSSGGTRTKSPQQKSAFTKVNLQQARTSPNLSISPDLSYQNSLSPSPPIMRPQYQRSYQNAFLQENLTEFGGAASSSIQPNVSLMEQVLTPPKMRPMLQYPSPYQHYPSFPQERAPAAAAIFSSLLPPSLAALSLPAQNICAKCNISFRMTSDLVYHMRSHHKNDIASDISKRRREEKLKCPVCAESFRERHHLTRHMTAHQDKEGDGLDAEDLHKKKASAAAAATFAVFNNK